MPLLVSNVELGSMHCISRSRAILLYFLFHYSSPHYSSPHYAAPRPGPRKPTRACRRSSNGGVASPEFSFLRISCTRSSMTVVHYMDKDAWFMRDFWTCSLSTARYRALAQPDHRRQPFTWMGCQFTWHTHLIRLRAKYRRIVLVVHGHNL